MKVKRQKDRGYFLNRATLFEEFLFHTLRYSYEG